MLEVLRMTEKENLRAISETVRFLKAQGREVIFDAERFFDGYRADTGFAMRTLEAAKSAGADVLCLCDSNGETVTELLAEICAEVRKRFDGVLGIQTHNDADLAVANTLAAIDRGFTHVQGSMNGYGERCGNANLCSLIPDLELKMGHTTVGRENLHHLTAVARLVADYANLPMRSDQPYVGRSAFLCEAGCQAGTILKDPVTSERTQPRGRGQSRTGGVGRPVGYPQHFPPARIVAAGGRADGAGATRVPGSCARDGTRWLRTGDGGRNSGTAGSRSCRAGAALLRGGRV